MFSMVENLSSFLKWLDEAMRHNDVSPADIARTGFVSDSAISLLISGVTKSVSVDMCKAISKATGIPLITVYRAADILPKISPNMEIVEQIEEYMGQLPNSEQADILEYAKHRLRLIEQREKNDTGRPKDKAPATK